jgi:hypothetical protein
VHVDLINYRKDGTLFRNLLMLRDIVEYRTEADAKAKRNGVYRYVIGVQKEVSSDSMLESRIVQVCGML